MPRQLRAMGKRKPSLDMRYLLIMMRAEETAIQPRQAPAVITCTIHPRCSLTSRTCPCLARGIPCSTSCLLAMELPQELPTTSELCCAACTLSC